MNKKNALYLRHLRYKLVLFLTTPRDTTKRKIQTQMRQKTASRRLLISHTVMHKSFSVLLLSQLFLFRKKKMKISGNSKGYAFCILWITYSNYISLYLKSCYKLTIILQKTLTQDQWVHETRAELQVEFPPDPTHPDPPRIRKG